MSFFERAQGTVITGGNFGNEFTTNINSSGPNGIDILLKASYPDAAFDSSTRDQPPRCWPGTRAECIEFIMGWPGLSGTDPPPMLWIHGPAGVGKSAVAQTCSEKLKPMGRLGAAFFFSALGERDNHSRFFPTIAYQLCTEFPDYRDLVDRKITRDKTLVDKMMVWQFKDLIVEPLRELERCGKGIGKRAIIVDGLDECADPDAQREIIQIIAESVRERTTPLCWAFFSRPEPIIRVTFAETTVSSFLRQRNLRISQEVDGDIKRYLRGEFQAILRRSLPEGTPSAWPSDDDMEILVAASGGLFIYATTIIHFVSQVDSPLGPDGLLKEILTIIKGAPNAGISSDRPFARLDAFYRLILERFPPKAFPSLQLLLCSLLFFRSGVNADSAGNRTQGAMLLANMLQLSEFDFRALCNKCHAIMWISDQPQLPALDESIDVTYSYYASKVPPHILAWLLPFVEDRLGGIVHFHHRSFVEFLVDQSRSGKFCIETPALYNRVAKHCLQQRLQYAKSYCLGDTGPMLAPGVLNSAASLSWSYSNELINSILKYSTYTYAAAIVDKAYCNLEDTDLEPHTRRQISYIDDHALRFKLRTHLFPRYYSSVHTSGALSMHKVVPGIEVFRYPPSAFDNFDVSDFKKKLAKSLTLECYHPYHPPLDFLGWALLRAEEGETAEWGLCATDQGADRLFYYWELSLKKRYCQGFYSMDLMKGQKAFREQIFLWSANDHVGASHDA